jgi:hypothetical protein
MTELKNIFNIHYPKTLIFSEMDSSKKEINFVSSKGTNNGVVDKVAIPQNVTIYKKGSITVPLKGSVLEASLQIEDFIIAHQTAVLENEKLSIEEKIFYVCFIKQYKRLYNYGRQADKTLKDIIVPEKHEIPSWVYETEIPDYSDVKESKENKEVILPEAQEWKEFLFSDLFNIVKAKGPKAKEAEEKIGNIPYVTATSENNGIKCFTSIPANHRGNCLTIGHLGDPFYQTNDFSGNNVTILYDKVNFLNQYVGLFLVTLMQNLPKKYNYGNVVGIQKLQKEVIKLPVDQEGNPDWQLMEDYIKSLPYSKYL